MSDVNAPSLRYRAMLQGLQEVQTEIERLTAQQRSLQGQIDRLEQQRWQIALGLAPILPAGGSGPGVCETACQPPLSAPSESDHSSFEPRQSPPVKELNGVGAFDSTTGGGSPIPPGCDALERRVADLESFAGAVLNIALVGAQYALREDLHKSLRKMALNESLPAGVRDMLVLIANEVERAEQEVGHG